MGFTDQDSCREKLRVDVELNTQGLIYWQQKINGERDGSKNSTGRT